MFTQLRFSQPIVVINRIRLNRAYAKRLNAPDPCKRGQKLIRLLIVCRSGSRSGFDPPAEARGLPYPGQLRAANHASDRGPGAEPAVQSDDGLQHADGTAVGPSPAALVYNAASASLGQVRHTSPLPPAGQTWTCTRGAVHTRRNLALLSKN